MNLHLVSLFCLLAGAVVYAHPPTTFSMLLVDENNPNTTINNPYNLTFYIYDMLNNNDKVNYTQLVPEHDRMMHVMLACGNMKEVFHLHIDDFSTPEEMAKKDSFFVTVSFPTKGKWYIATSFMVNISGVMREGSAQYEFFVEDFGVIFYPTYDFYTNNTFRSYPLPESQIFLQEINTTTNIQKVGGYTVEVTFSPNTTHIQPYFCQPFYVTVKDPNGQPVTNFVPFLDAPMHIIFVAEQDTVYHGHGMDLPSIAPDLESVKTYAKMVGMPGMDDMTVEQNAVMMNAMMTGINNQGVLNCTADLGAVMQKAGMDPWMPMLPTSNYTFGPKFMSIFDFPNPGNWKMFMYFRIQEGNETVLIVPHFSLNSDNSTYVSSAVHVVLTWHCVALVVLCSLAFM
eukprot:Phypoly_transcript_11072.p1 GENE.Phypoly_transcript_11072~~Phypoly_transcript_11072.p1  ORF type:complete len:398 (+),score=79.81 Phypoly_transcript_11072:2-1195(+)